MNKQNMLRFSVWIERYFFFLGNETNNCLPTLVKEKD